MIELYDMYHNKKSNAGKLDRKSETKKPSGETLLLGQAHPAWLFKFEMLTLVCIVRCMWGKQRFAQVYDFLFRAALGSRATYRPDPTNFVSGETIGPDWNNDLELRPFNLTKEALRDGIIHQVDQKISPSFLRRLIPKLHLSNI